MGEMATYDGVRLPGTLVCSAVMTLHRAKYERAEIRELLSITTDQVDAVLEMADAFGRSVGGEGER